MDRGLRGGALVGILLLAAVLFAGASLLLIGPTGAGPGPSSGGGGGTGELEVNLPAEAWAVLFLAPLASAFGLLIYRRLTEPSVRGWGGVAVVIVVMLLLYVALLHGGGGPGFVSVKGVGGGGNNTTLNNSSNGTNGSGTGPSGSGATAFNLQLPPFALGLVAAGLCAVVLALLVPGVVSRLVDRRGRGEGGGPRSVDRSDLAAALAEAADALDRGADARDTVVRLYLSLLFRVAPMSGELSAATAEEIRRLYLAPLGVPPEAAETLTRLFEEARYSTHPIGEATVAEARAALRAAESALRQGAATG